MAISESKAEGKASPWTQPLQKIYQYRSFTNAGAIGRFLGHGGSGILTLEEITIQNLERTVRPSEFYIRPEQRRGARLMYLSTSSNLSKLQKINTIKYIIAICELDLLDFAEFLTKHLKGHPISSTAIPEVTTRVRTLPPPIIVTLHVYYIY